MNRLVTLLARFPLAVCFLCIPFVWSQNEVNSGVAKLNSKFLDAIRKGDVKKMNLLAGQGASVDPPGFASDVEDIRALPGGGFTYKCREVARGSWPLLAAIQSDRPESVRALRALGADVRKEFYQNAASGVEGVDSIVMGACRLHRMLTLSVAGVALRVGEDGVVNSAVRPTPARKDTYLGIAERLLVSTNDSKRRQGLHEIVDVLRPVTEK